MNPGADFFGRAAAPVLPPRQPTPADSDIVKRLQCEALWTNWRLQQAGPGWFYFLSVHSEACRSPNSGFYTLNEVEQFLRAREREQRLW